MPAKTRSRTPAAQSRPTNRITQAQHRAEVVVADQHEQQADHREQRHRQLAPVARARAPLRTSTSAPHSDERELGELGRLHLDRAEVEPEQSSARDRAELRRRRARSSDVQQRSSTSSSDEQHERDDQPGPAPARGRCAPAAAGRPRTPTRPTTGEERLLARSRRTRCRLRVRLDAGRREHHGQADDQQQAGAGQQQVVGGERAGQQPAQRGRPLPAPTPAPARGGGPVVTTSGFLVTVADSSPTPPIIDARRAAFVDRVGVSAHHARGSRVEQAQRRSRRRCRR